MATIAIVLGGALVNASAFIGGNYLARYLSGEDPNAAIEEKKRHDRALEKYQADVERFQEGRERLQSWIAAQDRVKHVAAQNLTNVDFALKLYNKTHEDHPSITPLAQKEPRFADYYTPSQKQKTGELVYVGGGALAVGYLASRFI